jgi:hypothetical protein
VTAWSIAALAGAAAIWLEPISVTLGYGQINVLIAALVVPALLLLARRAHQRHSRWRRPAAGALLALGYAYAPEHLGETNHPLHPGPLTILTADPYVLAAILALGVSGAVATRTYVRREITSAVG